VGRKGEVLTAVTIQCLGPVLVHKPEFIGSKIQKVAARIRVAA
jgi:hypothetical protein